MNAGRKPVSAASCDATSWLRARVEISRPCPSAGIRKADASENNAK